MQSNLCGLAPVRDPARVGVMAGAEDFYKHHRGGSGAVVMAYANRIDGGVVKEEREGIFSCLETAEAWRTSLGEQWVCVYAPYIVDDPDWGNELQARENRMCR